MTSSFENVFSRFYLRVEDYNLGQLSEDIARELLIGYIRATFSKPFVRKLFTSVSIDEDFGEIVYELREPLDDAADQDFVEEMLAFGMTYEWCSPRYHSSLNTMQAFTNKEQQFFSQQAHMTALKQMYDDSNEGLRKLVRDRAYANSYIKGVT